MLITPRLPVMPLFLQRGSLSAVFSSRCQILQTCLARRASLQFVARDLNLGRVGLSPRLGSLTFDILVGSAILGKYVPLPMIVMFLVVSL